MKDIIESIISIIEEEYFLYRNLLFNEIDKGIVLYINQTEYFNVINEHSQHLLEKISSLITKKNMMVEKIYCEDNLLKGKSIQDIIEKVNPERLSYFREIKERFKGLLFITNDINSKNTILMNNSFLVTRKILSDILGDSQIYNEKGSMKHKTMSTIQLNI